MVCRLCLENVNDINSILLYSCNGHEGEMELIKIIAKYLQLEITPADGASTSICQDCWTHLDDFHKFCKYIDQKQSTLRNEFLEVKCVMKEEAVDPMDQHGNCEESLLDVKDVCLIEQHVSVTSEHHDVEHPDQEFAYAVDIDCASMMNDAEAVIEEYSNSSKAAHTNRRSLRNAPKTKLKKRHTAAVTKVVKTKEDIKQKPKGYSQENSKKTDEFIANHFRLKCEICDTSVETFAEIRVHYKSAHNVTGYVHCCGKRFTKRIILVDHLNLHLNPKYFQCKVCDKALKSRACLEAHMINRHSKSEDLIHECPVCGKKFATMVKLRLHSIQHKTEKNFVCKICDKAFVCENRLNMHTKAMHDNVSTFICDTCGRVFKCKTSFDQHVAKHQGIYEAPVQCSLCAEWFTHKKSLGQHMKRHEGSEVECKLCGRICKSATSLQSHIRYIHKKKRNLPCSFCEKTFKIKKNLEEHIAIHTGEKNHTCPHCIKEFRSKSNMYMHIKKFHVEEWLATKSARSKAPQNVSTELE